MQITDTATIIRRLRDGVPCSEAEGYPCKSREARSGCDCAIAADKIESDAKVIADKDAEIARLNNAFDDCAEREMTMDEIEAVASLLYDQEYMDGASHPVRPTIPLLATKNRPAIETYKRRAKEVIEYLDKFRAAKAG